MQVSFMCCVFLAVEVRDKNASDEDDLRLSPGYERYVGGSEP